MGSGDWRLEIRDWRVSPNLQSPLSNLPISQALGLYFSLSPHPIHIHDRQCLCDGAGVLFGRGGVVPKEIGDGIERAQQPGQQPVAGGVARRPRDVTQDGVEQEQRQQRPQRTITGENRQRVGRSYADHLCSRAEAMKPEPAAHRVERIAGCVAGARLHLRVLMGDEVAADQFVGLQAGVERGNVEQQRQQEQQRAR